MKFVDVTDPEREVPFGERGEICVKGPNVMKGYWKAPEANATAFTKDGFFRTGDVGYMDEDGFVFIVDRTKDMLLCGGYNVYPRNIEEAIYQHPSVEEVSVIGVPDAYRGEAPKAFVKLRAGRAAPNARRPEGIPQGPARQARNDLRARNPGRAAEDPGRQDLQEGSAAAGDACGGVAGLAAKAGQAASLTCGFLIVCSTSKPSNSGCPR